MLERDGYIPGVPCWIDTAQPDLVAALAFYGELFGWEFTDFTAPDSPQRYVFGRLRGKDVAGIGLLPDTAPPTPVWNHYIWVDSADATAAAVTSAGGTVVRDPVDIGDGGRTATFADPAGAHFSVWEARAHRGAQLVNEPGTWNFSELYTSDVEGAKAFYGAVFGWEASDLGDGSAFWRMPGYGDFLEQRNPGLRERMAGMGAPKGFEDAVAWLAPLDGGAFPADSTPHWSMTFAVADADEVARRTVELGGEVLVAPRDDVWVRMTVIRDPQGAVFTASKFNPPS